MNRMNETSLLKTVYTISHLDSTHNGFSRSNGFYTDANQ